MITHIGVFEGIGGFSLAARWMGWETIAWCENDKFCQNVLRKHFPKAKEHGDIRETDFTIYRGLCNILTGGFPCQPYSLAGKRKGKEDDRHLWPEMLRAIKEIQPDEIVGENVFGIVNWSGGLVFEEVQADLEAEGYEVTSFILPAASINAWHKRDRVWFIAHRNQTNEIGTSIENAPTGKGKEVQQQYGLSSLRIDSDYWEKRTQRSEPFTFQELTGIQRGEDGRIYPIIGDRPDLSTPCLCRSYDGIPNGMDRVAAYGNAIVPQVAFEIFKAIEMVEVYGT